MESNLVELSQLKYSDMATEERIDIFRSACQLLNSWKLQKPLQLQLLGIGATERGLMTKLKRGEPVGDQPELLMRAANLFGIHLGLRALYPLSPALIDDWVQRRTESMGNSTPLQQMLLHGLPGIIAVREHLDISAGRSESPHAPFKDILALELHKQEARLSAA